MIVVVSKQATLVERTTILDVLTPHCERIDISFGDLHDVFGLVKIHTPADEDRISNLAGVERVIRIEAAYKLVSLQGRAGQHSVMQVGQAKFGNGFASIIGGPCAVESYDLTMASAVAAMAAGALVLRGDLFKARTSPYNWQGLGAHGFEIVRRVMEQTGLPWVMDVLTLEHVKMAADNGISCLRIGARYAQSVELVEAAAETGLPIMLKRGFAQNYVEWLDMAEYIALARGSSAVDVILCERGIRTFEDATRNTLDINAFPWMRRHTHLPIIGDPSHASGNPGDIPDLMSAILAARANGLMVDVHVDPSHALCDGAQALRPAAFAAAVPEAIAIARIKGMEVCLSA